VTSSPLDYAPSQPKRRQSIVKIAFVLSVVAISLILTAHLIFRGVLPSPVPRLAEMTVTGTLLLVSVALGSIGLILAGLAITRARDKWSFASLIAAIGYFSVFLWLFVTGGL
jgi:uncharacterized membrane protein YozB (DUF420 family)